MVQPKWNISKPLLKHCWNERDHYKTTGSDGSWGIEVFEVLIYDTNDQCKRMEPFHGAMQGMQAEMGR